VRRIDWAPIEISVQQDAIVRIKLLRHLNAQGLKYPAFLGQISAPIRGIDLLGSQFTRYVGVSTRQRGTALDVVHTNAEQDDRGNRQQD
jgi:hypothetical protein